LPGDYVIKQKSHFTGRLWSSWQTIRKVRYIAMAQRFIA